MYRCTPCISYAPISLVHLVVLGDATTYEVDVARTAAGSVVLHLQRTRLEHTLLTDENVYSVMLAW